MVGMLTGRHSRIPGPIIVLLLLLAVAGCHKVTEYSSQGEIGVTIVDLSSLSVEGTIKGFEGGRAICSLGEEEFLVSSNRGRMFWGNSADQTIEDVYTIGTAYSSGYGCMTQSFGTVYVIGGYGQILEFSLNTRSVIDEFNAGPLPIAICRPSFSNRLYVSDGQDSMIREVWTSDNEVHRENDVSSPAVALTASSSSDSSLIGVSGSEGALFRIYTGPFYIDTNEILDPSSDVAALPDTLIICATNPVQSDGGGVTLVSIGVFGMTRRRVPLDGQPFCVCVDAAYNRFYVASYLGDGASRIYEIDAIFWDVTGSVDIDGYPRDITMHAGSSELLVLTSE